ncbi:MAG: glycosyltransferase [Bacteroidaceae bacterium]
MKVLHFGTFDSNAGGPAMSTYLTLKGLRDRGVDAELIQFPLSEGGKLRGTEVPVHYTASPVVPKICYSPKLKRDMRQLGEYDIYHAQGVWQYPTYAIADVAKQKGKPYLITPRGMLYPQDIAKANTFFKKLSLKWRLLEDLNKAACVQVTCEDEMVHCRNLGVTASIAIIPNPVEIKDYPFRKEDNIRRIGYLGRLSPRKNVEGLIHAFAELGKKAQNAELLIIGGGDEAYEAFLKKEVERLRLKNVVFAGFLNGEEKDKALASCSILAMPSEFENLGNVILEGLVRHIPCIATTGSPWRELNECECGWWVEYSQETITEAVEKALEASDEQLTLMGDNGRKLMEARYSVEAVAERFELLYRWILGKGEKPEFVLLGGGKRLVLLLLQPCLEEERRAA